MMISRLLRRVLRLEQLGILRAGLFDPAVIRAIRHNALNGLVHRRQQRRVLVALSHGYATPFLLDSTGTSEKARPG